METTEKILKFLDEEHICPHCQQRLSCCHTPPFHVGDGLGWGTDIFFVCLNDECSLFADSWQQFEEQYGHCASCRYVLLPDATKGEPMMVGSKDAFTGSVVDPESLKMSNSRYCKEKEAVRNLATCVAEKNLDPVLCLILDEHAGLEGRNRACELLADLNDTACIDPIRNHSFKHTEIEQQANMAIAKILKTNFQRECPHCMEIIKIQAKACKHCNRDI